MLDSFASIALFLQNLIILYITCIADRSIIKLVQIIVEFYEKLALDSFTETAAQLFYRGNRPVLGARGPLAFPDISSVRVSHFDETSYFSLADNFMGG